MWNPRSLVLLAPALSVLTPSVGAAFQLDEPVPRALTQALLSPRDRDLTVFVGYPPQDVTRPLPLRATDQPIGGLYGPSQTVVVFAAEGDPEVALNHYESHLAGSGWDPGPGRPGPRGGFVSTSPVLATLWCQPGLTLQATALRLESTTYLQVRVAEPRDDVSMCDPQQPRMMPPELRIRFPTLNPPEGAVVSWSGVNGSSERFDMEVSVQTRLSNRELFEHYRSQLTSAGWVPSSTATSEDISIGRWDTVNDAGEPAIGVLGVWASSVQGTYRAWIRLALAPRS